MQLATNNGTAVISGGVLESNDFTMQVDGKMFKILSDTLYQNKIGSMIREVSCNAMDSHIQAGKAGYPFHIHAPNSLEPWFSVQDQGIGLSHDEVVRIFTCFGKSTKSDSNTQVGAFGFGSKSPFAYTDSFSIISTKDGIKRNYSAVIKEDGTPTTMLLDESSTNDPNGVEIKVAVNPRDFPTFYHEIVNQLAFFSVKPIVSGATIIFRNEFDGVTESFDGIHFRNSYNRALIVQGGVSYPFNIDLVLQALANDKPMQKFVGDTIRSLSPIIFFNIGEIEVTPSREAISYSKRTIDNIVNRLRDVKGKLADMLETRMAAIPTRWDRAIFIMNNNRLYSTVADFSDATKNKWGIEVNYGNAVNFEFPDSFNNYVKEGDDRISHNMHFQYIKTTRTGNPVLQETLVKEVIPRDSHVFVIDDGSSSAKDRIRNFFSDSVKGIYFVKASRQDLMESITINPPGDGETIEAKNIYSSSYKVNPVESIVKDLKETFAGAKFYMLADLPKPEREKIVKPTGEIVEKPRYVPAKMYRLEGINPSLFNCYSKEFVSPKSIDGNVCYVMVGSTGRSIVSGLSVENNAFITIVLTHDESLWNIPIYAIREKDIEKVKNNPLWQPLNAVVEVARQKFIKENTKKIVKRAIQIYSGVEMQNIFGSDHFMSYFAAENKVDDADIKRYIKWWKNSDNKDKFGPLLREIFDDKIAEIKQKLQMREHLLTNKIKEKFPIIDWVNTRYMDSAQYDKFIHVLNLLNKEAKGLA